MSKKDDWDWFTILGLSFFLSIIIIMIFIKDRNEYKLVGSCTDKGGYWEKYNCRIINEVKCSYSGIHITECHVESYEQCNEHCANLPIGRKYGN